jgi:hypothetical protein
LPGLPWLYRYREDGPRAGSIVLRPVVPVTLLAADEAPPVLALIDSGSEHVLAAPWLAQAIGVDPDRAHKTVSLGIGGETVATRFVDATLRLHPPGASGEPPIEWQTAVGFVHHWRPTWPILLGQVGFLDRFSVSFSRQAQLVAIEEWDAFDRRFGVPPATTRL